ncbi:hypothetical protein QE454_000243 [Microbacterium sp. SORGH_AS454]|nr:hypothetical protein [Microbacterium sp. SORGH_AS_0454]
MTTMSTKPVTNDATALTPARAPVPNSELVTKLWTPWSGLIHLVGRDGEGERVIPVLRLLEALRGLRAEVVPLIDDGVRHQPAERSENDDDREQRQQRRQDGGHALSPHPHRDRPEGRREDEGEDQRDDHQRDLSNAPDEPGHQHHDDDDLHGADGETPEAVGPQTLRWRLCRRGDGTDGVVRRGVAGEQAHAHTVLGTSDMAGVSCAG